MMRRFVMLVAAVVTAGCDHSDPISYTGPVLGPVTSGSDVRLTFNPDQDYWPTWTEDGRGILYAFTSPGDAAHRCLGIMPRDGGTRTWTLCDNRFSQADSASGFGAFALDSSGRLLFTEAVAPLRSRTAPVQTTLWLADSSTPYNRASLLTMPTVIAGTELGWLADIAWTGHDTFVALAQQPIYYAHCRGCGAIDTVFSDGGFVVVGTITAGHARLDIVAGTLGATGYALVDGGATIVFTRKHDVQLFEVPIAGGTAVAVATVTPVTSSRLLGVSCVGTTCVVAVDAVRLTDVGEPTFPAVNSDSGELRSVSLLSGEAQRIRLATSIVATPRIAPGGHDVLIQLGGNWGHLQTFATAPPSDLFLLRNLLP